MYIDTDIDIIKYIFTFIFRDNTSGGDCYLSEQVWLKNPFRDQLSFPHCTHIKTSLWLATAVLFADPTAICDFIVWSCAYPRPVLRKSCTPANASKGVLPVSTWNSRIALNHEVFLCGFFVFSLLLTLFLLAILQLSEWHHVSLLLSYIPHACPDSEPCASAMCVYNMLYMYVCIHAYITHMIYCICICLYTEIIYVQGIIYILYVHILAKFRSSLSDLLI